MSHQTELLDARLIDDEEIVECSPVRIEPNAITPEQYETRRLLRAKEVEAMLVDVAPRAIRRACQFGRGGHGGRGGRWERDAVLLAETWKTFAPRMGERGTRRGGRPMAVETIDDLSPYIRLDSIADAARLCQRSRVTVFSAIIKGHRCGGRRWGKCQ